LGNFWVISQSSQRKGDQDETYHADRSKERKEMIRMATEIYTLDDLFRPMNTWVDTIIAQFSKIEVKGYRITREFIMELLMYSYTHEAFRTRIVSPLAFHLNFKELYRAYMDQWEK
jgi:hypothetical protein